MTRSQQDRLEQGEPGVTGRLLRLLSVGLVVNFLLLIPRWLPGAPEPAPWIAIEAWIAIGLLALLPARRWSRALAAVAATLLVAGALALVGDALIRQSLARPLNLYLDLALADALFRLIAGTMGTVAAVMLSVLLLVAGLGLVWALTVAVTVPRPVPRPARRAAIGLGAALLLAAGAALLFPDRVAPLADRPLLRLARIQARVVPEMLQERERFIARIAALPTREELAGARPLARLGGRDVILGFVESYGISAITDPRYAPVIRPRLRQGTDRLAAAGLHVATGTLIAPSQGGMSWLGHGAVLSGLWLDNQLRYDLLMSERPPTLIDDFRAAGYRTAALMPAITLAWPEGRRLGYDRVWARADIDYAGPPLNWVTMPDQFTWSFLEQRIRRADDPRPLFAEIGLISSHAPWTPILEVLESWEGIGNGEVFERWRDAGEPPVELWRDHDRVREHYALSLDYALAAAISYAERFVDERTLLIVMGDHQPAPMITGEEASRAVPVHVIAREAALVAPFLEWGFVEGMLPPGANEPPDTADAADAPAPPGMDAFRPWFLRAFSVPDPGVRAAGDLGAAPGAAPGDDPADDPAARGGRP